MSSFLQAEFLIINLTLSTCFSESDVCAWAGRCSGGVRDSSGVHLHRLLRRPGGQEGDRHPAAGGHVALSEINSSLSTVDITFTVYTSNVVLAAASRQLSRPVVCSVVSPLYLPSADGMKMWNYPSVARTGPGRGMAAVLALVRHSQLKPN